PRTVEARRHEEPKGAASRQLACTSSVPQRAGKGGGSAGPATRVGPFPDSSFHHGRRLEERARSPCPAPLSHMEHALVGLAASGTLSGRRCPSGVMLATRALWVVPILLSMGCGGSGLRSAEAPGRVLPLRTVRLYETGVGYFERSGPVSRDGESLPLPTAHIDDALKTLVVLSQGGARVAGVEFESVVSRGLARSLAGLPDDPEQAV